MDPQALTMVQTATHYCMLILLAGIGFSFIRLAKGPSLADRAVASDNIIMNLTGLVALYSIYAKTAHYLDLVLVFSLLGFIGMVCFAKFLGRGKIIE